MPDWEKLTGDKLDPIWDRFGRPYDFVEPDSSIVYDVSFAIKIPTPRNGAWYDRYRGIQMAFNVKALAAFRLCIEPDEFIYALDYHHEGYRIHPFDKADTGPWMTSIIADGDSAVFVNERFTCGTLFDPVCHTLCVWDDELTYHFERANPIFRLHAIRRGGITLAPVNHKRRRADVL
jgi:hypothetical protein